MTTLTDAEAQRAIDNDILALKTRRNTHSAISKLPIEVLAGIFLHGKQSFQNSEAPHHSHSLRGQSTNWLNVSGVCRHWRAVVLDTPRLWCYINLSWKEQRAFEILRRSKSAPLQVRCTPEDDGDVRFRRNAKAVMKRPQRIQELDINFRTLSALVRFLALNPSGSAAALEVLTMELRPSESHPRMLLPALWHSMPSLRVLELNTVYIASNLPSLPSLTRLVINSQASFEALSASWLLQALRGAPRLEEIEISVPSSDFSSETRAVPPIALPHLTSLRMTAERLDMSAVFDCLNYPPSAVIQFSCPTHSVRANPPDFASLERVCARFAAGATLPDEVRINVHSAFQLELRSLAPSFRLHLSLMLPIAPSMTRYVELCSMLPFEAVRSLDLSGFNYAPIAEWLTLFPRFEQVTTLTLTKCGYEAVTSLLMAGDMQGPPFEKLETILMIQCEFNFSRDQRYEVMCDAVVDVLKQRKALGRAIRTLKIRRCDVTRRVISEFGDLVVVDWDEVQIADKLEASWDDIQFRLRSDLDIAGS